MAASRERAEDPPPKPVEVTAVRVEEPPPTPPAEPKPKEKPKPPAPPPKEIVDLTTQPPQASEPPPTESSPDAAPDAAPVFGLSKQSFGTSGAFAARRGNTLGMRAADSPITDAVGALRPVPVYSVTKLPEILGKPDPRYPPDLRAGGIEGDVVVELVVTAEGEVGAGTLRVLESSDRGFDEAALEAVGRLRFTPATQGRRRSPCGFASRCDSASAEAQPSSIHSASKPPARIAPGRRTPVTNPWSGRPASRVKRADSLAASSSPSMSSR